MAVVIRGTDVTGCSQLSGPRNQACTTSSPVFISSRNIDHLTFNSCNTTVGAIVSLGCLTGSWTISGPSHLKCLQSGQWNGTTPVCKEPVQITPPVESLSLETKIIIGVVCGFAALALIIILTLSFVYHRKIRHTKKWQNSSQDLPMTDFYSINTPQRPAEDSRSNYYKTEINPMYSSRIWRHSFGDQNSPAYYSTANRYSLPPYAGGARSVSDYDRKLSVDSDLAQQQWSPRTRPPLLPPYSSVQWDPENMKWHEMYDYSRHGRLPRYHMDERGLYSGIWANF